MVIARRASLTMTGMLLINAVLNSHSLVHDSITRWFEAIMEDHIQLLTTTRRDGEIDDDGNNYVRRNRKLVDRQSPNSSNSSNNEIEKLDQSLLSFLSDSALGRQKVIEFMIDQYVSPTSPDDNMIDKLDNAIEAISLLETDAEPVQVVGYPFLFVGSVGASLNHKALQDMGITSIINWSSTARCHVFDDIEYMCIEGIRGAEMQERTDELAKAVDYVESVRLAGGKAMSHCWYGVNRSVTLVVAYLMKYEGMTAADATDLIKKSRSQAEPYLEALQEYSNIYLTTSGLRRRSNSENGSKKKGKQIIPNDQLNVEEDQS